MMKLYSILLIMAVGLGSPVRLLGQVADSAELKRSARYLEFQAAPSYLLPTNQFLDGVSMKEDNMRWGTSLYLKYGFKYPRSSRMRQLYPDAYQGIGIGYHLFPNREELGNPVTLFLYQGSRIAALSQQLTLDYEWNFGVSFGWKPYDKDRNPYNHIAGSRTSAYMSIGLSAKWRISPEWCLALGTFVSHYSNGNTSYPNSGLNTLEPRISLCHTDALEDNLGRLKPAPFRPQSRFSFDVTLYGSTRKKGVAELNYLVKGDFGILGMTLNPLYTVNRYFKTGPSADIQYDESANIDDYIAGQNELGEWKFYRPPFGDRIFGGISWRGEFSMSLFSVNIGLGHSIYAKDKNQRGLYQFLGLKTFVTPHIYLHTGYMLSKFKNPRNLMLGIGYRFGNTKMK